MMLPSPSTTNPSVAKEPASSSSPAPAPAPANEQADELFKGFLSSRASLQLDLDSWGKSYLSSSSSAPPEAASAMMKIRRSVSLTSATSSLKRRRRRSAVSAEGARPQATGMVGLGIVHREDDGAEPKRTGSSASASDGYVDDELDERLALPPDGRGDEDDGGEEESTLARRRRSSTKASVMTATSLSAFPVPPLRHHHPRTRKRSVSSSSSRSADKAPGSKKGKERSPPPAGGGKTKRRETRLGYLENDGASSEEEGDVPPLPAPPVPPLPSLLPRPTSQQHLQAPVPLPPTPTSPPLPRLPATAAAMEAEERRDEAARSSMPPPVPPKPARSPSPMMAAPATTVTPTLQATPVMTPLPATPASRLTPSPVPSSASSSKLRHNTPVHPPRASPVILEPSPPQQQRPRLNDATAKRPSRNQLGGVGIPFLASAARKRADSASPEPPRPLVVPPGSSAGIGGTPQSPSAMGKVSLSRMGSKLGFGPHLKGEGREGRAGGKAGMWARKLKEWDHHHRKHVPEEREVLAVEIDEAGPGARYEGNEESGGEADGRRARRPSFEAIGQAVSAAFPRKQAPSPIPLRHHRSASSITKSNYPLLAGLPTPPPPPSGTGPGTPNAGIGGIRLPCSILGVRVPNRRGEVFARPLGECLAAELVIFDDEKGEGEECGRRRASGGEEGDEGGKEKEGRGKGKGGRKVEEADEMLDGEARRWLPAIVVRSLEYLNEWGKTEEGIYRVPGRSTDVDRLRVVFDAGCDLDLKQYSAGFLDPHAVASTFKLWLREIPDSLLGEAEGQFNRIMTEHTGKPATLQQSFGLPGGGPPTPVLSADPAVPRSPVSAENGSGENGDPLIIGLARAFANSLAPENWYLLRAVVYHLHHLTNHTDTNRMTLDNLRLILSPTLRFSTAFVELIVEHRDELFGRPNKRATSAPRAASTQQLQGSSDAAGPRISPLALDADVQWAIASSTVSANGVDSMYGPRLLPVQLPGGGRSAESLPSNASTVGLPELSSSADARTRTPIADLFKRTSPIVIEKPPEPSPPLPTPRPSKPFVPLRKVDGGLFTGGLDRWTDRHDLVLADRTERNHGDRNRKQSQPLKSKGSPPLPNGAADERGTLLSRSDSGFVPSASAAAHVSIPIAWSPKRERGPGSVSSRPSTAGTLSSHMSTFPVDAADTASQYLRDSVWSARTARRFSMSSHMSAFPADAAEVAAAAANWTRGAPAAPLPQHAKSASVSDSLSSSGSPPSSRSTPDRRPGHNRAISQASMRSVGSSFGSRWPFKRNTNETADTSVLSLPPSIAPAPKLDVPFVPRSQSGGGGGGGSRDSDAALAEWLTVEQRLALFNA